MSGWQLPARAKLNLVLRVVGRRADGYHLLETLFHALELHDDLWVGRRAHGVDLVVTADDPRLAVGAGPDNLVVRALTSLAAAARAPHGFAAALHKRIPHGGGLGGGSSDAAAALRLGNLLLDTPLPPEALHRLAVPLGADVAFFLRGGSQWGRGIGDELEPVAVPPIWFVLLVPPFGCPTADVYKNHAALWKDGRAQDSVAAVTVPNTRDSAVRIRFVNDLEPAAERVRPDLAILRRRVEELGFPGVRMTGSGSTLFVACDGEDDQQRCLTALAVLGNEGVRLVPTRSAAGAPDTPVAVPRPAWVPGPWPVPDR